jgi:K+-sensing histidine kinase KdpD
MAFRFDAREHRSVVLTGAVLVPPVLCAVLSGFRDTVSSAPAALLLVLVVVAAAATGDRTAGLLAALSGGVWFDFFLTQPYYRFTISKADDVWVTVLLVVIGAAVTELALWGNRQEARAGRRAGYLDGALRVAEVVAARDESPEALVDLVRRQITDVLGISACRFVAGPVHDARLATLHHDGTVTRGGQPVKVEQQGLPSNEETALLVTRGPEILGHFVLTAAGDIAYPSVEQRRVAVLLADQVASVLGSRAGE